MANGIQNGNKKCFLIFTDDKRMMMMVFGIDGIVCLFNDVINLRCGVLLLNIPTSIESLFENKNKLKTEESTHDATFSASDTMLFQINGLAYLMFMRS